MTPDNFKYLDRRDIRAKAVEQLLAGSRLCGIDECDMMATDVGVGPGGKVHYLCRDHYDIARRQPVLSRR
jgi:hypothetical protein